MVFKKGHKQGNPNKRKNTMLRKYGKLIGRKKTTISKKCLFCDEEFSGSFWYIKNMKYCSNKCVGKRNTGILNPAKDKHVREKIRKSKIEAWKDPSSPYNQKDHKGHYTSEVRRKLRIKRQRYILSVGGRAQIGKNETQILDELAKKIGYKILRQYPIIGYYLDGYIPELNIAIEIDEKYHKTQLDKDILRQQEIENKLNCKFLRIKDDF